MALFGPGTVDTEARGGVFGSDPSPKKKTRAPFTRIPLMPSPTLETRPRGETLRVVDLVEHQLAGDLGLGAVQFAGPSFKRRHHLLDHFVEEHGGQLRMQQGAKLEGNLSQKETGVLEAVANQGLTLS